MWSRAVAANCAFLAYYAACSGNTLPTFQDNVLAPSSGVKNPRILKMGPTGSPETSVISYQYNLHSSSVERSSHLFRGGSLISHIEQLLLVFAQQLL
jgi:hypothetical protein